MSRILIVENDHIVRMHLVSIIESMGHDIMAAVGSGADALDAVAAFEPELVMLDVHLDGDLDGIETGARIRERSECGIVFATAFADARTVDRSREAGALGYLVKPFDEADVRAAVTTALVERQRLLAATHQQRWLSSVLGGLGEAILVTDAELKIVFANHSVQELGLGSPQSLEGKCVLESLAALREDLPLLRDALQGCKQAGSQILPVLTLTGSDGQELLIGATVRRVDAVASEQAGLVLTLRNLSMEWEAKVAPTHARDDHTRVMIYSHDTLGLGHLRRSLNIAAALVDADPHCSVLIVTGSAVAHRFELPDRVDYVKLPAVRKVASDRYSPRSLELSDDGVLALRSNLLLRTTRDFQPDIFIVDHAPRGMRGEMLPSLEWLRHSRPDCRRIIGLRDIIDDPELVRQAWARDDVFELLASSYHDIVIYGNREVFDLPAMYEFPQELRERCAFVDYVVEEVEGVPLADGDDRPMVVVSTGGGDGAVEAVIGGYLDMLEGTPSLQNIRSILLPGPLVANDLLAGLRTRAAALGAELLDFVPSTSPYFAAADLVIATAGYNTSTQILRYARNAILIPRILHRREQLIRAERLQALGLAEMLHPDSLDSAKLAVAVEAALRRVDSPLLEARTRHQIRFHGASTLAQRCLRTGPVLDSAQEVGND